MAGWTVAPLFWSSNLCSSPIRTAPEEKRAKQQENAQNAQPVKPCCGSLNRSASQEANVNHRRHSLGSSRVTDSGLALSTAEEPALSGAERALHRQTAPASGSARVALSHAGHFGDARFRKRRRRRISPLQFALTRKRARKPHGFRTYQNTGLKSPWNQHIQKNTRGGTPLAFSLWMRGGTGRKSVLGIR